MNRVDFDGWMTKPQAAEQLGVDDRTVERLVVKGKLHQAMKSVPGRRPLPVYDPEEIAQLKAEMNPPFVLPGGTDGQSVMRTPRGGVVVLQSPVRNEEEPKAKRPHVPVWNRVYLNVREAAAYTGFRQVDIESLIASGGLPVREFEISEGRKRRLVKRELLDRL